MFILLTDSLSSLEALLDPFSDSLLIQRIDLKRSTLYSINSSITFIWIPGHMNLPEHVAVDKASKEATKFTKIADSISPPASDYEHYFRSLILSSWNSLWQNQQYNMLLQ